MKFKDFAFYAVSIVTLVVFAFLPIAHGLTPEDFLPGVEWCKELIGSVDHYMSFLY